ncbi:hypothetical protein Glove_35g22 [Diversispora epigaea]|uniref:Transcription factor Pcc1 n=1 Tax=Diversispora epigaea TaxID=1348612 RepID=A0A397JIL4_9GLOM|nr:hypothetical protein Glove_35g22 [Diversispora epigaea]
MNEANEVHSMILNIPFPSSRLANIAQKVLKVDKELKTDQVERIITVEEVNLIVKFKCSNIKILRISVNSILDMIIMVIKTMDAFDGTE